MALLPRYFGAFVIAIVLVASVFLSAYSAVDLGNKPPVSDRIYELRTYTTHDGKLPNLLDRFNDHTVRLFARHGMVNVGYWVPVDKKNTLVYLLSHDSREAAEKSWQAFLNDPEWQKAFEASRVNGPLVQSIESVFMKATPFSQIR